MPKNFFKGAKNVRHFKLVSRSQNDKFADDPNVPNLVLEPFVPNGAKPGQAAEFLEFPASLAATVGEEHFAQPLDDDEIREREAMKQASEDMHEYSIEDLEGDCYFPLDGYNYEKHLKKTTPAAGSKEGGGGAAVVIEAPLQVSKEALQMQPATSEEAKAALRALELAEEYEEFEEGDGLLEELLDGDVAEEEDVMLWGPTVIESRDMPDPDFFKAIKENMQAQRLQEGFDEDDDEFDKRSVRSHRSVRSFTSSKRQAEAVTDEQFEQFMVEEYGDEEIGGCEEEEIEGQVGIDKVEEAVDEYLANKKAELEKNFATMEPINRKLDSVPRAVDETKALIAKHYNEVEAVDLEEVSDDGSEDDESKLWDCETVLSTLSNLSNRPGKIGRIKLVKKPEAPALKTLQEAPNAEKEAEESEESEEEIVELPDVITVRPKGETPEERRLRKASVKEMKRVCRRMKKESKDMYKTEAMKVAAQPAGGDVRAKTRCLKL